MENHCRPVKAIFVISFVSFSLLELLVVSSRAPRQHVHLHSTAMGAKRVRPFQGITHNKKCWPPLDHQTFFCKSRPAHGQHSTTWPRTSRSLRPKHPEPHPARPARKSPPPRRRRPEQCCRPLAARSESSANACTVGQQTVCLCQDYFFLNLTAALSWSLRRPSKKRQPCISTQIGVSRHIPTAARRNSSYDDPIPFHPS